jgi:hypothetical protein
MSLICLGKQIAMCLSMENYLVIQKITDTGNNLNTVQNINAK